MKEDDPDRIKENGDTYKSQLGILYRTLSWHPWYIKALLISPRVGYTVTSTAHTKTWVNMHRWILYKGSG